MTIREKIILEGEDRASSAFKSAGGNFDGMVGTMKKAAGALGLAFVGAQLVQVGVKALRMASDAEEAGSAFATTFGPAVGEASDFVDEFANKAGFANHELEQMLAITGNVVQGIGATEAESADLAISMATLAGDVASFSNAAGGAQAVMGALQSAINGEREALKTYGLALSEAEVQQRAFEQTGKTSADELTRLEKAQATVTLAYEKAGKAVGDLDRTSDSAANTMRRVGARMKEAGVQVGGVLLKAFEGLLPTIEMLIPTFADAATSAGKLLTAAGPLAKALLTILGPALKAVTRYLDLVADGMTSIAALAGDDAARNTLRFAEAQDALATALANGEDPAAALANSLAHVASQGDLTAAMYSDLADQSGLSADRLNDVQEALLASDFAGTRAEIDELNEAFGRTDTGAFSPEAARAINFVATASRNAAGGAEEAAVGWDRMTDAYGGLSDRMLASTDPVFAAVDAMQDLADVQGDAEATALDVAEATIKAQDALNGLADGNVEGAIGVIAAALGIADDEARALLDAAGLLNGMEIRTLIAFDYRFGNIPEGMGISPEAGREAQAKAAAEAAAAIGLHSGGGGFATGGKVNLPAGQPTMAIVHGQEQIATPATFDAMVSLLGDIRDRSSGGATITIPITVHAGAGADGAAIVRDIENQLAQSQLIRRLPERL